MYIDNEFVFRVYEIAEQNPEGFTVDLRSLELINSGIAVAYADTQNQIGKGGLHVCIQHALYNHGFVGGWRNPQGYMQFDSIRIFHDLPKAIKFGRKQKQFAIYDIDNGWEIIL